MAAFNSGEAGAIALGNVALIAPSRPIRILWKFHCGTARLPAVLAAQV